VDSVVLLLYDFMKLKVGIDASGATTGKGGLGTK
jgi:hypothetical protein